MGEVVSSVVEVCKSRWLLLGGWRALLDRKGMAWWEAFPPLGLICW